MVMDNVLWVTDSLNAVVDAVLLANGLTGLAAADSETAAETVRVANKWTLPNGTLPAMGFYVDDNFRTNAVQGLGTTGTAAGGDSIQRGTNVDSDNLNGWATGVSTFGVINVGQVVFP